MNAPLLSSVDRSRITPMMLQYMELKESMPDCVLFFRLGDFYEMFFDDAVLASRELELTLTGRDCGLDERAPMCGVPYHSAESYIARLISRGHKVAIGEQTEDPAQTKTLVRREIVRVITPGTVTDPEKLDDKSNNYLLSVYRMDRYYGIAVGDLTTGALEGTTLAVNDPPARLLEELARVQPSEILCNEAFAQDPVLERLASVTPVHPTVRPDGHFSLDTAERLLPESRQQANALWAPAAAALLLYLEETQRRMPDHMQPIRIYQAEQYMAMDPVARRNLELVETLRDKSRKGSLLWVLDRTQTSMGGRMLRRWLEQPLAQMADIHRRLDAVEELKDRFMVRQEIRERLHGISDLERLTGKASLGTANARDLRALQTALSRVPYLRDRIKDAGSALIQRVHERMDPLEMLCTRLDAAISEEAPVTLRDGGLIREGFSEEIDRVRAAATQGKDWILEYEQKQRDQTGIKTLKVGYNRVFGYYIDVTRANSAHVPSHYIRRQTLANSERYVTEELKEMEDTVLGAHQRAIDMEYELFVSIRSEVADCADDLLRLADAIAVTDVLANLAEVADRENYCRPDVSMSGDITARDSRHAVVEKIIGPGSFVPNDVDMDMDQQRLLLITGPNMSGKSTYMRQIALMVILAQCGSFVPAREAHIGICDRIFTRIGASDDLASGDSTFMVEMKEVADILRYATSRSLLILDEIGRGTSTFDGLSIAFAVMEHIADRGQLGARTLFATHYHELTDLEGRVPGVVNYRVAVEEQEGTVQFLHRIERGGSDDSYGVEVARLAGVPDAVVQRAYEILHSLETEAGGHQRLRIKQSARPMEGQMNLFSASSAMQDAEEILERLRGTDIPSMTPLDAMNLLYDLVRKAQKRDTSQGGS